MYIVAIAWIYVVLMMSITEESIIAGLMTFALYGILPLTIILYIMGSPQRKRQRHARELAARAESAATHADHADSPLEPDAATEAAAGMPPSKALPPPATDYPSGDTDTRNDRPVT